MRVLEEYRVPKEDFEVLDKRPHPMLTVRYCGVEREMSLPSTPKTRGKAPVAYAGQLRRLLKNMQMESLGGSYEEESHEVIQVQEQSNHSLPQSGPVTMSSREIADLVDSRHDDVKRSIVRLAERGVIILPPMARVRKHTGQTVQAIGRASCRKSVCQSVYI